MTETSSAAGTIAYQYDEKGNLLSVTNHNGDAVSYAYDQYGNKTSMTYPDGREVAYTYDAMNRMTSVVGLDGDVTRYTYDAAGRRVRTASGTLTTEYSYDSVGNLIRQETSGANEIAFTYSHNKNGYITGEKRTENGQTTDSAYAYDALGQLTAFTQSTGYGERYAYDAAGNMLQKVITGTDGKATALSMQYNAGNQLTSMAVGQDSIAYAYDANGSMIRKTLTSAQYGTLTDTYTYDVLNMLTGYAGYDGYTQQFTYDANGMRQTKREKGSASRSTLEELLRGNIPGLPDIVEPADTMEEGYEWATTEYLYDITQEYYQVIRETCADNSGSTATAYAYGLERIAAYTADSKATYVYDGRGSVVQTMTAPIPGATAFSSLPDVSVKVQSFSYTAYGEQMGAAKSSGFTYNAEAFDAATGMLNLRARQYEVTENRFIQKDAHMPINTLPFSHNEYLFTYNNPLNFIDADGLVPADPDEAKEYYAWKVQKLNSKSLKKPAVNTAAAHTDVENPRGKIIPTGTAKTTKRNSASLLTTAEILPVPGPPPSPLRTPSLITVAPTPTNAPIAGQSTMSPFFAIMTGQVELSPLQQAKQTYSQKYPGKYMTGVELQFQNGEGSPVEGKPTNSKFESKTYDYNWTKRAIFDIADAAVVLSSEIGNAIDAFSPAIGLPSGAGPIVDAALQVIGVTGIVSFPPDKHEYTVYTLEDEYINPTDSFRYAYTRQVFSSCEVTNCELHNSGKISVEAGYSNRLGPWNVKDQEHQQIDYKGFDQEVAPWKILIIKERTFP